MHNWAGNIEFRASAIACPRTLPELASLVAESERIKVFGSRHSFNGIADTSALHLSLENLPQILDLDPTNRTVTVGASLPYGDFCEHLHLNGWALPNLASLPHISVAGACATATHGSGRGNRNLATAVRQLELITAEGELVTLSNGDPDFSLAVVGLGAVGIVHRITLDLEESYNVRQWVFQSLPMTRLEDYFEELMQGAYSVSLFTDWRDDSFSQVWLKERISADQVAAERLARTISQLESHGAVPAEAALHPVNGDPGCCTEQLGLAGPWYDRLPHFRMSFTPSAGRELQSEYFVPFEVAPQALRALTTLRDQISPHILVTEVRSIAADDLAMSPCFGQACAAIHFTWSQALQPGERLQAGGLTPQVERVLRQIECVLEPFGARPHLGKLFTMDASRLQSVYPNLPRFREYLRRTDPTGKLRNGFINEFILGSP